MTEPRLMSGADAAAYCGVTPATWSKWVAGGIVPPPLAGTRRWDRKAIDTLLDKASGIVAPAFFVDEDFETAYVRWEKEDEWERRYAARKAAEGRL